MDTNMKAIGIVMREQFDEVNRRITEHTENVTTNSAVMEAGVLKQLTGVKDLLKTMRGEFDTLEIYTREQPEVIAEGMEERLTNFIELVHKQLDEISEDAEVADVGQQEHISELFNSLSDE